MNTEIFFEIVIVLANDKINAHISEQQKLRKI